MAKLALCAPFRAVPTGFCLSCGPVGATAMQACTMSLQQQYLLGSQMQIADPTMSQWRGKAHSYTWVQIFSG